MAAQTIYPFTNSANYTFDSDKIEVTGGKASLKRQPSAQTDNEDYETPGNYSVSDSNKIEVASGQVQLKLVDNTGQSFNEDFADDTGFTYDSGKAEFSGGQVQQKDQRPTNATFYASYSTDIDGDWGNGTLTGTAYGGASVVGGKLDLSGGTLKYVTYNIDNLNLSNVGCVRIRVTPDYSGNPSSAQNFFDVNNDVDTNGRIVLAHTSAGELLFRMLNNVGAILMEITYGGWTPVSGTEVEIEVNWDLTTGLSSLYIDGTRVSTDTSTGTFTHSATNFRVGTNHNEGNLPDFKARNLLIFDAVQHTGTSYTPDWSNIYETIYISSNVDLPQFSYTGLGTIQAGESFSTTDANSPRYTIKAGTGNYYYWTGATWAVSDSTYAQASSEVDINTNIGTHPDINGETTIDIRTHFDNGNPQMSVDDLTLGYTGQLYDQTNPYVTPTSSLDESALEGGVGYWDSFTVSETKVGSDEIKYILSYNDGTNFYYWSGAAWVVSNEAYSQANTGSEVNTNIGSFPVTNSKMMIRSFLHSDDGSTQPTLQNVEIGWTTVGAFDQNNPTIVPNTTFRTDLLISLSETSTKPGSTEIKYILSKDGIDYYHNGSSWVVSDGTYSQSNLASEINTNASTFTTQDVAGIEVEVTIFLHAIDDTNEPEINELVVSYDFTGDAEDAISTCKVWGYVNDSEGNPLTDDILIDLVPNVALYKNNVLIESEIITVTPNDDGYFEVSLIENENMEGIAYYRFKINNRYMNRIVPDATSKALHELVPLG